MSFAELEGTKQSDKSISFVLATKPNHYLVYLSSKLPQNDCMVSKI